MVVELRPIAPEDQPFLLELYATTRRDELAMVPWTDEQKRAFVQQQFAAQAVHYERHYPKMQADIVEVDGRPAGRLLVDRGADEIRIVDITLTPEHRGRLIGTGLLRKLQEEAASAGKVLSIHVESSNPALSLYQRLGFVPVREHGIHHLMEWRPGSAGP